MKSYSVPPLLTSVIYFGGLLEISKSMQSLSCRTLNTFLTSGKELPSIRNQIKPPSPSFAKRRCRSLLNLEGFMLIHHTGFEAFIFAKLVFPPSNNLLPQCSLTISIADRLLRASGRAAGSRGRFPPARCGRRRTRRPRRTRSERSGSSWPRWPRCGYPRLS